MLVFHGLDIIQLKQEICNLPWPDAKVPVLPLDLAAILGDPGDHSHFTGSTIVTNRTEDLGVMIEKH